METLNPVMMILLGIRIDNYINLIKNLFLTSIILLGANLSYADIDTLDISDRVLAISKIAKPGKVSVFIISTHWCGPCVALKSRLQQDFNMKKVDIYYCLLSKSNQDSFKLMNKRPAYRIWKFIEGVTDSFPFVYIVAPTTNIRGRVKGNDYNKIQNLINELLDKTVKYDFNKDLLLTYLGDNPCDDYITKPREIVKKVKEYVHDTVLITEIIYVKEEINLDSIADTIKKNESIRIYDDVRLQQKKHANSYFKKAVEYEVKASKMKDGWFWLNKNKTMILLLATEYYSIAIQEGKDCWNEKRLLEEKFPKHLKKVNLASK